MDAPARHDPDFREVDFKVALLQAQFDQITEMLGEFRGAIRFLAQRGLHKTERMFGRPRVEKYVGLIANWAFVQQELADMRSQIEFVEWQEGGEQDNENK